MRALLQRVLSAQVTVEGRTVGSIGPGLLVFAAVHRDDTREDGAWLIKKILNARLFTDDAGKMGRSIQDMRGELLLVPQFTLYGDLSKGTRPDFGASMAGAQAKLFFEEWLGQFKSATELRIETGQFAAHMEVTLVNDGPVTLLLDSR